MLIMQHVVFRLFVCNYGEGGNLISAPVYQTGPSYSSCPPSTSCSPTYPGLCSAGSAQSRPSQPAATTHATQTSSSHILTNQQFRPSTTDLTQQPPQHRPSTTTTSTCTSFICMFTRPTIMMDGMMDSAHSVGEAAMTTVQNLSDFVFRFNSGFFG